MRRTRLALGVAALATLLPTAPPASAATNVQIAGLQSALRAYGHYRGPVDGIAGPQTRAAVRQFQHGKGLAVDGVAGPQTRAALGTLGQPLFGTRVLRRGAVGWDVSVLQFLLKRHGHLGAEPDGSYGPATTEAVRRFQARRGLAADGVAGPATFAALAPGAALAPPTPAPAAPPALPTHVVREGETLTAIAERYGTSVDRIARANGLDPARVLLVATRLRVPGPAPGPPAGQPLAVRLLLDRWAAHHGIDPSLLRALAWQESGFQNHVVSSAGAFGVMQVTPATWEFVEVVLLGRRVERTVEGNVRVGAAFLAHLLRLFGGDERLALGAYYRGPEAVRRHGLGPETTRYVENVLALRRRM
ncbi:MAG TPA: peptidoglycan-binding protein [Gaiellaceae bacterium]|nr:peptidoglycan-binding protein [Gaiellaceae bacterium]